MDPDTDPEDVSNLESWSPVNSLHSDAQRTGRSLPAPLWVLSGLLHPDDDRPTAAQPDRSRSPSRESPVSARQERATVVRRFRKDSFAFASTVSPIPPGSDKHVLLPLQSVHKARPGLPPPALPPAVRPAPPFSVHSLIRPRSLQVPMPSTLHRRPRFPPALSKGGPRPSWRASLLGLSHPVCQPLVRPTPRSLRYVPPARPQPAPERPLGPRFHVQDLPSRPASAPTSVRHTRLPDMVQPLRPDGRPTQVTRKGQEASRKAKALEQWKELLWLLGDSADLYRSLQEAKYSQQLLAQSIMPSTTAGTLETYLSALTSARSQ
ncbi:unnamed protein product [Symbiodinium sp. CCMP2592]|nr:unnamed protein product [Symbiodinium sp. CCMP2592]